MKNLVVLSLLLLIMWVCSPPEKEKELYKPHLGNMMLLVQQYHDKLYWAGHLGNPELATFYIHELKESLEDVEAYYPKEDGKPIGTLIPKYIGSRIDSIASAISAKDSLGFENQFVILTESCNNCHKTTDHAFIVVKKPDHMMWTNQRFENPFR